MKRLAPLVLAATAVLGTGCGPTCDSGTTLVAWSGFDLANGVTNQSCAVAGVATVDLWLDNQYVGNWPCTDYGAAVPGVPTGGNILTVEGLAGGPGSTILFRDELNYGQSGCGNVAVQAFPGQGTALLSYAFQAGSGGYCTNGTTYMWFTIFDDIAGFVDPASIGATNGPRQWPCGPTDPVVTLPNGQFSLGPMDAMSENPPGTFGAAAGACNATTAAPMTFLVTSGNQTVLTPTLVDGACLN